MPHKPEIPAGGEPITVESIARAREERLNKRHVQSRGRPSVRSITTESGRQGILEDPGFPLAGGQRASVRPQNSGFDKFIENLFVPGGATGFELEPTRPERVDFVQPVERERLTFDGPAASSEPQPMSQELKQLLQQLGGQQ